MQPPTTQASNTQPDEESDSQPTSRFELALDKAAVDGDETLVAPRRRSSDPGPEASLILIAHPLNESLGARFRLRPRSAVVIGRAGNADVSLPEISSLSRHHTRLTYRTESVVLEDLGSTNGTYVNGLRIEQETVLRSGDRFQVGAVHFKFLQERDIENAYHQAIHDLVVLDAPPLLGFAGPLQMATAVDGVIVVARAGDTSRKALSSVIATLTRLRANLVGVVLNGIDTLPAYSQYYYSAYGNPNGKGEA